jgi:hypothetical protein
VSWGFVLTDLNHIPVGEILNASERSVQIGLNKIDTLSFNMRMDNALASYIASAEGLIKAYRNNVLMFHGDIISAQETGNAAGATVAVNAASAGWRLSKRLAGKNAVGQGFTTTDRAQIVSTLINSADLEGETGISTALITGPSSFSVVSYTAGPYRAISDILTELSSSYDGFDWQMLPLENYVNGVVTTNKVNSFYAAPVIGTDQVDAVFEFGIGRNNVAGYSRAVNRDGQANEVFHSVSAGPDAPGFPTTYALNVAARDKWGLLEDVAQADITDQSLREKLVSEHVRVRGNPRQVITFEPHIDPGHTGRLPDYGTDYSVGDRVRARASLGRSGVRFDGMFRVWGVNFSIDNNGVEKIALTLSEE